jgi:hypothetical protein
MMSRSGIKPVKWSLFVDTDSLYLYTRQIFGVLARVDYLRLPLRIIETTKDIDYFYEKMALIMRLGKNWAVFSESLKQFGYETIPVDRGMQPITIGTKVMSLMTSSNGIVIVTSSNKIFPLVQQIKSAGGLVKMVSFSKDSLFSEPDINESEIDFIPMNKDWLWKNT